MKLSVIVPVYNERANIEEVIRRVKAVALPGDLEREIIIVDDGSTDGTAELLELYRGDEVLKIHLSGENFGKGTAIRVGIGYATGEVILIQDADLEYDPADYPALLRPILEGRATVVYGSRFRDRYTGFQTPPGMRFPNWLINKILKWETNLLYRAGITDEATAYKVFRAEVLKSLDLRASRFEFCPEVTAKVCLAGHRIHEVPITYQARSIAEGKKIRWQDGVQAMWTLLKYRFAWNVKRQFDA